MPNLDERNAFEQGLRIMLKLMEGCANEAMADGKKNYAYFLMGVVDNAEKDIPEIAGWYHQSGYETVKRQVEQACIVPGMVSQNT